MKEYYCLLLNNCYDLGIHWVCSNKISMIPNVLEKDIQDLYLLEKEFMDLDNTIINMEDAYHVLGSFPVFGEILEDGKMHDVITGKTIAFVKKAKETTGLSYNKKYKADTKMVEEMLTLIGDEEKKRYNNYLDNLSQYSKKVFYGITKPERYLALSLNNVNLNGYPIIAKQVNGEIIDTITKEIITPITSMHMVTSNLSANGNSMRIISEETAIKCQIEIIEIGVEAYIKNVSEAKTNSIRNYNTYIALNNDCLKIKRR